MGLHVLKEGAQGNKNQRQRTKGELRLGPVKIVRKYVPFFLFFFGRMSFFSLFFFFFFFLDNSWAQKLVISFWKIRGCVHHLEKMSGALWGKVWGFFLGAQNISWKIVLLSQKFQKYKISPAKKLGPTWFRVSLCNCRVPSKKEKQKPKEKRYTHTHTFFGRDRRYAREAIGRFGGAFSFWRRNAKKSMCAFKKLTFAQQKLNYRISVFRNGKKGPRIRPGIFSVAATRLSWQFVSRKRNWNAKVAWEEKLYVLYNTIWYNIII